MNEREDLNEIRRIINGPWPGDWAKAMTRLQEISKVLEKKTDNTPDTTTPEEIIAGTLRAAGVSGNHAWMANRIMQKLGSAGFIITEEDADEPEDESEDDQGGYASKGEPCAWCGNTPTEATSAAGERLCADDAASDEDDGNEVTWDEDAPQEKQRRYREPFACVCGYTFAERWEREDHWNTAQGGSHGIPVGSE